MLFRFIDLYNIYTINFNLWKFILYNIWFYKFSKILEIYYVLNLINHISDSKLFSNDKFEEKHKFTNFFYEWLIKSYYFLSKVFYYTVYFYF